MSCCLAMSERCQDQTLSIADIRPVWPTAGKLHRLRRKNSRGVPSLPSSEDLFTNLSYVLFVAPAAVVVIWMVWRVMVWCLFYTAVVSAWVGSLPAIFQIPMMIGLLLVAWPLLLLALFGWILVLIFPGLAVEHGEVPRLFARSA